MGWGSVVSDFAISVEEIAHVTNALVLQGDPALRVKTFDVDSRRIKGGELFVALLGERTDGHKFVMDAAEKGAAGAVICFGFNGFHTLPENFALLSVADSQKALETLGALWRRKSNATVVAITGSVGKTTARNILAHVLCGKYKTLASPENWNTEIGVPLLLAKLTGETEAVVVEMAMRGRGQIKLLSNIARPTHAVIVNVHKSHIGILGSEEEILRAKLEIASGLNAKGSLWLNADDKELFKLLDDSLPDEERRNYLDYNGEIKTFSIQGNGDVSVSDITLSGLLGSTFVLTLPDSRARVDFPLMGKGAISCAAAVAGVASKMGFSAEEIADRMSTAPAEPGRLFPVDTLRATLIDDSYNAGPEAVLNGIAVLKSVQLLDQLPVGIVFGDMLELGEVSAVEHERIGRSIASLKPDFAVIAGKLTSAVVKGIGGKPDWLSVVELGDSQDYGDEFVERVFESVNSAAGNFGKANDPFDPSNPCNPVILIKASNAVGFSKVVSMLVKEFGKREGGGAYG